MPQALPPHERPIRMIRHWPIICRSSALPWRAGQFGIVLAAWAICLPRAGAQTGTTAPPPRVQTVREAEFRSRWANPSVDRVPARETTREQVPGTEATVRSPLRRTLTDLFRTGPLQIRGGLGLGYEITRTERQTTQSSSGGAFVASPFTLLTYIREIGAIDLSAAYSAGYLYYSGSTGGQSSSESGLNQALRVDASVPGLRSSLRNSLAATAGGGRDIDTGAQTRRVTLSEAINGTYQLTEFTQLGALASVGYQSQSRDDTGADDRSTRYAATGSASYFWTGKTTLHTEVGAGAETRSVSAQTTTDFTATYVQFLTGARYAPTGKLVLDLSVGVTARTGGITSRQSAEGVSPAFRLNADWIPTEKIASSLYFGLEGADIAPQFSLAVNWQPRLNTGLTLSVYQRSGITQFDTGSDEVTRGALVALSQRFISEIDLSLSTGLESRRRSTGSGTPDEEPFTFVAASLGWTITRSTVLELFYRVSTGGSAFGGETRAGIRLNLTF